ncbi:MAG TPA: hypothetical protein VN328_01095 [Thermodesulfovibrionales bacterium]|nr:hypothetical protein [Thermodesulfovibrionales bacterium]
MVQHPDLENRIREIGAGIYSSVSGEVPSLFDTKKWLGRVMEWAMKDETFRFQLFRYIDVLPSLKSDALVGRQPFGGFGMSGVSSKAGGPDYLQHFMNPKSVSENTLRRGFVSSVVSRLKYHFAVGQRPTLNQHKSPTGKSDFRRYIFIVAVRYSKSTNP